MHYVSIPTAPLNPWPDLDGKEQYLLHEFQIRTGPELAGVHNAEFWLRYVVHIGSSEPAIKHAILGITVLQQQYSRGTMLATFGEDTAYALREYTKSISLLTKSLTAESMTISDTPLVACILYCAFESMSYHLDSAISHAGSGIKMFMEQKRLVGSIRQDSIPSYILTPFYTRLGIQGLELGETTFVRQSQAQIRLTNRVDPFGSIDDAQTTFDDLTNAILHAIYDIDRTISHSSHESSTTNVSAQGTLIDLIRRFSQWCNNFDRFVSRQATATDVAACLLLQVWRILLMINLRVDLRDGEMDFDRFGTEFRAIVDLSFAFVLTQSKLPTGINLGPPDSVLASAAATHMAERHRLCRSTSNGCGRRGGYLGIDPRCTPFIPDGVFDMNPIHMTTEHLLGMFRQQNTVSLGKIQDASMLSHDVEPSFCFSPGIISPLYAAVSRCRDPCIRRKALVLMQRCKRREGLWDSTLAARLGQRVIDIEEQRARELAGITFKSSTAFDDTTNIMCSSQIPNEARVRMIKPTFLPDRRSIERYYLGLPATFGDSDCFEETWIEEIIEW